MHNHKSILFGEHGKRKEKRKGRICRNWWQRKKRCRILCVELWIGRVQHSYCVHTSQTQHNLTPTFLLTGVTATIIFNCCNFKVNFQSLNPNFFPNSPMKQISFSDFGFFFILSFLPLLFVVSFHFSWLLLQSNG